MDRNSQFLRIYANLPLNQRNEIIVVLDDEELTWNAAKTTIISLRSEEHTSELQSHSDLVCRLLLEKKKKKNNYNRRTKRPRQKRKQVREQTEIHNYNKSQNTRHNA